MSFSNDELLSVFRQLTKKELLVALHDYLLSREESRTRQTVFDVVVDHPASHALLGEALNRKRRRIANESMQVIKRMRLDRQEAKNDEDDFFVDVGDDVRQ